MKRFIVVSFFLVLMAATASAWVRNSVYFSLYQIQKGLTAHSSAALEPWVDFEGFAKTPVEVIQAKVSTETATLPKPIQVVVDAIGSLVGAVASVGAAPMTGWYLRRLVDTQQLGSVSGGFQPNGSFSWFGGFVSHGDDVKWLMVSGQCVAKGSADASTPGTRRAVSLTVVFRRRPGFWWGYPVNWKAEGVESKSALAYFEACQVL